MVNIDKRGKLQEKPFAFRETKNGKVFIYWHDKHIMILKEKTAGKFLADMMNVDSQQAQLLMARITGHFKHGNEGGN